jgi:lysophospholipase L1-like esterase
VSVFLGTNDHYILSPGEPGPSGQPIVPLVQSKANMVNILTALKNINTGFTFNCGRPLVLCMSPPYVQDVDGASHVRISEYAEAYRQAAKEVGVAFVNVYEAMAAECDDNQAIFKSTYVDGPSSGVHPNQRGHEVIYRVTAPRLLRLLYEGV